MGDLMVPVNSTLVCLMSFLAVDAQMCVLIYSYEAEKFHLEFSLSCQYLTGLEISVSHQPFSSHFLDMTKQYNLLGEIYYIFSMETQR